MSINPYNPPNTPNSQNGSLDEANGFVPGVLRYSIELSDFIAFQQFHFRNSPSQRRMLYFPILVGIVLAIFLMRSSFARFPIWVSFVLLSIIAFVGILTGKFVFSWMIGFQTRRLLTEGSGEGLLGQHELEMANGFLIERTAVNEHRQLLSKIDRILETEEFAFVYISSLQAHVIPKRRIQHGDVDAFLEQLRKESQRG